MDSIKALEEMKNVEEIIGHLRWNKFNDRNRLKQAEEIYEKFKDGCETEFDNEKVKAFMYCGATYEGVTIPQLCPNCKEIKKIYDVILGDKE